MTDIHEEAIDALIELEAEAVAKKLGITLDAAREAVRELWNDGELEVRNVGDNKHILSRRGGKATWLHAVPGNEDTT
jgi:predicted transcriptional regulator